MIRRPNLYRSEHALNTALEELDILAMPQAAYPDSVSEPHADAIVARSLEASDDAMHQRDEFARFIREAEAVASAKVAEAEAYAKPLLDEAERIRAGVERMKDSALRVMERLNLKELQGEAFTIKAKDSRGSVRVVDESAIPEKFWRVKHDEDLTSMQLVAQRLEQMANKMASPPYAEIVALAAFARAALEDMTARRREVDKAAIQKAWREAGGPEMMAPVFKHSGPMTETVLLPVVPGVEKEVATRLEIS